MNNKNDRPNNNNKSKKGMGLSVLSWNMRGMKAREQSGCHELEQYLEDKKMCIDVMCLQETKLKPTSKAMKFKQFQDPIRFENSENPNAGGLCIYVRQGIPFLNKQTIQSNVTQSLAVEIIGSNGNITIYNYYTNHPKNSNYAVFERTFDIKKIYSDNRRLQSKKPSMEHIRFHA